MGDFVSVDSTGVILDQDCAEFDGLFPASTLYVFDELGGYRAREANERRDP